MDALMVKLGITFKNPAYLELSLTHKSFRNEQPEMAPLGDNERLEFLGDAVLDLALSDLLMQRFSSDQEGPLSKKRASLVNEEQLATLASEIGLVEYLRLGKGERLTGGGSKPRILASAFEAMLGALFIDSGYTAAFDMVARMFEPRLAEFVLGAADFARDYKTRLQELAQERFRTTPTYHLESDVGPDHGKIFEVSVRLEGSVLASGRGRNKKSAEQEAARGALEKIEAKADRSEAKADRSEAKAEKSEDDSGDFASKPDLVEKSEVNHRGEIEGAHISEIVLEPSLNLTKESKT